MTSLTRSSLLPDVPTGSESGLQGFDASLAYGLVAPAGTPRPIIDRLNAELRKALESDDVRKRLQQDGTDPSPGIPEDYAALIDKDETKWAQIVKFSCTKEEWREWRGAGILSALARICGTALARQNSPNCSNVSAAEQF